MDAWSPMSLEDQIRKAVEQAVPDSKVEVVANGSHFSLKVISPVFEGKKTLEKQLRTRNARNQSRRNTRRSLDVMNFRSYEILKIPWVSEG